MMDGRIIKRGQNIISEPMVFAFLTFLYLLFFTPTLQVQYHLFYQYLFAICIIAVAFQKNVLNVLLSKYSLPIILCLFTFFIFWLMDYGDRSSNTLKSFIRGMIIFLMSFAMARDVKSFRIMSISLSCALIFLAQQMMGENFFSINIVDNRRAIVNAVAENLNLTGQDYLTVSSYVVVFVAYICFSVVISFSFLDFSSKRWVKAIVISVSFITFIFCLKSLWTAPIIILLLSLLIIRAIHIITSSEKNLNQNMLAILKSILGAIIIIIIINIILSAFQTGEAYDRAQRLRVIFSNLIMTSSESTDYNNLSSGRIGIITDSIKGFLSSPIFGVGDITRSEYVSNHCSNLDVLARFGLIGFIPFIYMYVFYTKLAYRLVRMKVMSEHWTHISLLTFLLIFIISNFGNPYFLTSTPEILFFLVSGFVAGRYEFLTNKYHLFN